MKPNLQNNQQFLSQKSKLMVVMTQVINEKELNIIIQQISSPFATSQEEITSNVHEEEDQDDFANQSYPYSTKPANQNP